MVFPALTILSTLDKKIKLCRNFCWYYLNSQNAYYHRGSSIHYVHKTFQKDKNLTPWYTCIYIRDKNFRTFYEISVRLRNGKAPGRFEKIDQILGCPI